MSSKFSYPPVDPNLVPLQFDESKTCQQNPFSPLVLFLTWAIVGLLAACSPVPKPNLSNTETVVSTSTGTVHSTTIPTVTATNTNQPTGTASPTITTTPLPTITTTPLPTITIIPTLDQADADLYLKKGNQHLQAGELEEAVEAYNQAIIAYPWLYDAYYGLNSARKLLTLKEAVAKLDEEIRQLDQAINQNSKDAEALYKRGLSTLRKILISREPRIEETVKYENVTVIGNPPVITHLNMEEAITDFTQAIAIDTHYAKAYQLRGLASHLESLSYSDVALVKIDEEGIKRAIEDYEKAIQYDPKLASAYNDIGAAHNHLARIKPDERVNELNLAIEDYTKAINLDPQMTRTYINRAYAIFHLYGVLNYRRGPMQETMLKLGVSDASKAIELEPGNPWGYVLRGYLHYRLSEVVQDSDASSEWRNLAEKDWIQADEIGLFIYLQYQASDMESRTPTLTLGPSSLPEKAMIVGYEFSSPDSDFILKIPKLMSPNASMLVEKAESGNLLVRFFDDLDRWYSLQVHPGSLDNQGLEEWIKDNLVRNMEVSKIAKIEGEDGEAIEVLYRDEKREADCGSVVQYRKGRFYTVTYCVVDDTGINTGFRMFADQYQVQYSPVDKVLEEYLQGLKILSE